MGGSVSEERRCPRCEELDALEKYITEDGALFWICTYQNCRYRELVVDRQKVQ
jgi:hypothetical protein